MQRRIRRAWFARKERVAEKKRKAAELKAAQKPKRFGVRAAPARPLAATMTPTKVAAPSPAKKDPALSKTMTLGKDGGDSPTKEMAADPDL